MNCNGVRLPAVHTKWVAYAMLASIPVIVGMTAARASEIYAIGFAEVQISPPVIDPGTGEVIEPAQYGTIRPFGTIDTTTGVFTPVVGDLGGATYLASLAWNPNASNFYLFAERALTTISTSGLLGNVLAEVPTEGDGQSWINDGLARSSGGTLYAYNFENDTFGTVTEFAPVYTAITAPGGTGVYANGPVGGRIAFHGGTLYAAFNGEINDGGSVPYVGGMFGTFDLTTGVFNLIAEGNDYANMVLASDGAAIYGLDSSNLYRLDPVSGAIVTTTPLSNDPIIWTGAALMPVPEPTTCAMALAGMACGGFSMWRRRKRA